MAREMFEYSSPMRNGKMGARGCSENTYKNNTVQVGCWWIQVKKCSACHKAQVNSPETFRPLRQTYSGLEILPFDESQSACVIINKCQESL